MKKRTTLIVGGILGVLAILIGGSTLLTTSEASFDLRMVNGVCTPSDPGPMSAVSFQTVTWTVHNIDCETQYVSIRNFKHSQGEPAENPLTPSDIREGPINRGQSATLQAKAKPRLLPRGFKYEIWNGLSQGSLQLGLDPDIEIWP